MWISEHLYFAPGIRFEELDLDGSGLPRQLHARFVGYYLEPAEECCSKGHAFAAGVLVVSCIDALARLQVGGGVGDRFKAFTARNLPSFAEPDLAERLYEEIRNGLVHEARLKKGAQFSIEHERTVEKIGPLLLVNPRLLGVEIREALNRWVAEIEADATKRNTLANKIRADFADDLGLLWV